MQMTCIVGIIDNGVVYLGGDSAASGVDTRSMIKRSPKVVKKGNFLFGVCGNPRLLDILHYDFQIPERGETPILEYIKLDFINALEQCLTDNGFIEVENKVARISSIILMGYEGHLFQVTGAFQVMERIEPYDAIGSGDQIALGCFKGFDIISDIMRKPLLFPSGRIFGALRASESFDQCVRRPFALVSTDSDFVTIMNGFGEITTTRM
jgi:ATP-dependent protease HslVU (ClpYQ) peptidase subunit